MRVHRVGKYAAGKMQPLIARMMRSIDKLTILGKRKELREKNLGETGDLTVRQSDELRQAKVDRFFAFFKGGVLRKEERRQPSRHNQPAAACLRS